MYDLTKHFLADKKQILSKIESVLNRGILKMGEKLNNLKKILKNIVVLNIVSQYLLVLWAYFWH